MTLPLITALAADAVPADPRLMALTNGDGSTTSGYLIGDEHFHFMVDAERSRLIYLPY